MTGVKENRTARRVSRQSGDWRSQAEANGKERFFVRRGGLRMTCWRERADPSAAPGAGAMTTESGDSSGRGLNPAVTDGLHSPPFCAGRAPRSPVRGAWEIDSPAQTFLIADPRLEMRLSTQKIDDLKISNRLKTGGAGRTGYVAAAFRRAQLVFLEGRDFGRPEWSKGRGAGHEGRRYNCKGKHANREIGVPRGRAPAKRDPSSAEAASG